MKTSRGRDVETWEQQLKRVLPLMGHRNWIVVADSAYPVQSNLGIETIATGAAHQRVLGKTLWAIAQFSHVRVKAYLDAELKHLRENDASGANAIRQTINRLLEGQKVCELAHEQLIAKLDESAKLFRIFVLKSTLTVPYTSVFLELDCGYWNDDAENRLRRQMQHG